METIKKEVCGQFELFNIKPEEEVLAKCVQMCMKYGIGGEDMVDQWFAYTSSILKGAPPTVEYLEQMERKEFLKNIEQESSVIPVCNESAVSRAPTKTDTPIPTTHASIHKNAESEPMDTLPSITALSQSSVYSQRINPLSLRCSYGPCSSQFKRVSDVKLKIALYEDGLKSNQRYMFETLGNKMESLDAIIEATAISIIQKHRLFTAKNSPNSGLTMMYGIIANKSKTKLNYKSLHLQQSSKFKGHIVHLNLTKLPKCSLFPGQVIVVKGDHFEAHCETDEFLVEELYIDGNVRFQPEPPLSSNNESLQIVVACGPFTTQADLTFEPLLDLMHYVKQHRPHVLILAGPSYDKTHQGVLNGELKQTFDDFFFDLIDNLMHESADTQIILISSRKEAHHHPIYPTPPYEVRQEHSRLHLVPDPCMVTINGLVVAATTADVLFDVSAREFSFDTTASGGSERMARLASHVLKQKRFYPVYPPSKGMRVDFSLMAKFGEIDVKPHILILPSNLRHFIKEIDDCLVINPERLVKGNGPGTFARIEIIPGTALSICGRSSSEILQI